MHNYTPLSILVLDPDLQRGCKLGQELHERSSTLAIITDDLGAALEVVRTDHPTVVVVSEDMGNEAVLLLQAADPRAMVVVVANQLAA